MAHDLIFLSNRRTPKVVKKGAKYKPKPSEGRIVRRRAANESEEKTIRNGGWVRVNQRGEKPGDSGYMKKKSKVRPQLGAGEQVDDEQTAQEDLAAAQDRLGPAATAAIAAGVILAFEHPEFADADPDVAGNILFSFIRYPSELITQVALAGMFSPRWSAMEWDTAPGVTAGWQAGRSVMVSTAQYAARKAKENPPSEDVMTALKSVVSGEGAAPEEISDYGKPDLMAQAAAHAVLNSAPMAAASAAGHTHKTWNSRQDRKVRPTHNVLDSHAWPEHTVPISEAFISPGGATLMFPGDPTAPLEEIANCRCWLTFTTPKRGESYGQSADLATNPPEMQGNPSRMNPV